MKTEILKPNYVNVFEDCIAQVKAVVSKEDGQSLIVEMLEYGKRLYENKE